MLMLPSFRAIIKVISHDKKRGQQYTILVEYALIFSHIREVKLMKYTVMTILALFVSDISLADEITEEIQIPDTVDMRKFLKEKSTGTEDEEKMYGSFNIVKR